MHAKEAPKHIKANWPGSAWIVELLASDNRDGKPFNARHLFITSLRTTPEALLRLDWERWSNYYAEAWRLREQLALDSRHPAPRGQTPLSRQWRWRTGDTPHRGTESAAPG